MNLEPGAGGLDEGHQLAFVVRRAAGDDDRTVARVLGQAGMKRRCLPLIQGVRRLHIIVAVEQHMGAPFG